MCSVWCGCERVVIRMDGSLPGLEVRKGGSSSGWPGSAGIGPGAAGSGASGVWTMSIDGDSSSEEFCSMSAVGGGKRYEVRCEDVVVDRKGLVIGGESRGEWSGDVQVIGMGVCEVVAAGGVLLCRLGWTKSETNVRLAPSRRLRCWWGVGCPPVVGWSWREDGVIPR